MTNDAYWAGRILKIGNALYNWQEKRTIELLKTYKKAQDDINKELEATYGRYQQAGKLTYTELAKYNRLETLHNNIADIVRKLGGKEYRYTTSVLSHLYGESLTQTAKLFNISFTRVPENLVEAALKYPWSGENYSSRIWANKDKLARELKDTVTQGIIQGKGVTQMTNAVKEAMGSGAYETRRLVRTEAMHMINQGHLDAYKKAGRKKVEWLAAKDERTCPTCGELHEQRFEIGEEPPCPAHPHCRCRWIPVVETGYQEYLEAQKRLGSDSGDDEPPESTVKELGEIDASDRDMVESFLKEREKEIVNQTYETAIVVKPDGEVLRIDGTAYAVNPRLAGDLTGAYITHNHPENETNFSFSGEDLDVFINDKAAVLRGVDHKYTYQYTRTTDTVDAVDSIAYDFNHRHRLDVLGEMQRLSTDIDTAPETGKDELLYHAINEKLSERLRFKYERKERND
jgi:SPP1 gp7 family putative phage head morphogenesis protein